VKPVHYSWMKPHLPNLTGTPLAYRPSGHTLAGGRRAAATGDYQAWSPDSPAPSSRTPS
jgi:NADH:ubiquinone oxidoreductase subunit